MSTHSATALPKADAAARPVLAVHGGAGTIGRASLSPGLEARYRAGIDLALRAGHAVLSQGGSSVDAVVAAVKVLEDDPLFNAGKGAVFTHDGRNELDASIMDGRTGLAGAVAGVTTIKNPITAARAVMDRTRHVLLIGAGAEQFAAEQQLDLVDPAYFHTPHRQEQLRQAREQNRIELDHDGRPNLASAAPDADPHALWKTDDKFGTVGAVALDTQGNLAAATSTGGLTNKRYGRVGDSPLIGAGTFADNATAAVSATGTGEFFMRGLVAYDIAARIKYLKATLSNAVDATLRSALDEKQGAGGVIALDARGNITFGFNTEGMYRGHVGADGQPVVQIYRD